MKNFLDLGGQPCYNTYIDRRKEVIMELIGIFNFILAFLLALFPLFVIIYLTDEDLETLFGDWFQ
jgi:hypothetical protein